MLFFGVGLTWVWNEATIRSEETEMVRRNEIAAMFVGRSAPATPPQKKKCTGKQVSPNLNLGPKGKNMRFLHTVSIQQQSFGADGKAVHDLPVNPLSVIILMLRPLNVSATASHFASYMKIAAALNSIQVNHRGQSVVSMSGGDAAAMAYMASGVQMLQANHTATDNHRRAIPIPIFLGNSAYDPSSCFPGSSRGDLTISLDFDVASEGYDTMEYSIETIELLDAKPTSYVQQVEQRQTFDAVGLNDVDLPVGNVYSGVLLAGGDVFTGATPAPTWGRVASLVDNQTVGYSSIDFETIHGLGGLMGVFPGGYDSHAGGTIPSNVGSDFAEYAYLPFDPRGGGMTGLDTKSARRFHLRCESEATGTVRLVPREVIRL